MASWSNSRMRIIFRRISTRSTFSDDTLVPPGSGRLVVDPVLHEAGIAIALARHLRPARQQADRDEEQVIFHMRRVVAVFLEAGMGDLLVVRVVLELARCDRDRGVAGIAFRAGVRISLRPRG